MTALLGHFRITVYRARLDNSADWVGKVDPYCEVSYRDGLGNRLQHTTPVARTIQESSGTVFEWDDTHTVVGGSTEGALDISVYDKDLLSADDLIGCVTLSLIELEHQMAGGTSVDGRYKVSLDIDLDGMSKGTLIVVMEPSNVVADQQKLEKLIAKCRDQESRLRAIHGRLVEQVTMFQGNLRDVRGKEGRESLAVQYEEEIEGYRRHLAQIEGIYNTIWRKRMFLDLRMPLVLLHKRRPCELMLPGHRLNREGVERFQRVLEAQIGLLKGLAKESALHVAGLRRNLVIARDKVSHWVTDDTRTEVNTDRSVMVDAYVMFAAQMREVADRHDLALDHLKFQLLRMSSPQIDLAFLKDDLDGMVEATNVAGDDSLSSVPTGLLLDAVPEVPGLGAGGEDEYMIELHVELEANLAAVEEIERLL